MNASTLVHMHDNKVQVYVTIVRTLAHLCIPIFQYMSCFVTTPSLMNSTTENLICA